MTKLNYAKHQHPYRLKVTSSLTRSGSKTGSQKTPQYSGWVKLSFWDRERPQERAGRLDLLLTSPEQDLRYEVELMLGATDESHIIRCIEYWDIERRRYLGRKK